MKRYEVEVDTDIAEASKNLDRATRSRRNAIDAIMRHAGARRHYRTKVWDMTFADAMQAVQRQTTAEPRTYMNSQAEKVIENYKLAEANEVIAATELDTQNLRYQGWSRFFIVQGGHIHASMSCSTCNNGQEPTSFGWLPDLSGLTEKDAVDAHGALLCTVCFPTAPVEWTNGRELAAAERQAAQCVGSGTYDWEKAAKERGEKPRYGRRYQTCPHCNKTVSITSNGKLRAHKKEA